MGKTRSCPEQLVLSDELRPASARAAVAEVAGEGARRAGREPAAAKREQTIWAHEAGLSVSAAATYAPVQRRDPDWVARNFEAAQHGASKLTTGDTAEFVRLLDEQLVYEAITSVDLDSGIRVTLQEKRRRGLAIARRSTATIEDLHIPLCPRVQLAITNPACSHWLVEELAYALKGDLKPAIKDAESLHALLACQHRRA